VWNCNGLTERKLADSDFLKTLIDNDIIILSETWTNSNSNITLEGYESYNFYRKVKHKNAKRHSGGIVIYVKSAISHGVSIVRNHFDTLIWMKIDKYYFYAPEGGHIQIALSVRPSVRVSGSITRVRAVTFPCMDRF
jgi:exonuclease III